MEVEEKEEILHKVTHYFSKTSFPLMILTNQKKKLPFFSQSGRFNNPQKFTEWKLLFWGWFISRDIKHPLPKIGGWVGVQGLVQHQIQSLEPPRKKPFRGGDPDAKNWAWVGC